jgi:hypothetical protein
VLAPALSLSDQDRLVTGGGGELREGQVDQGDQVISAASWGVAGPQQAGQRLTRGLAAIQVGQQRVEPQAVLVGAGRACLASLGPGPGSRRRR